MSLEAADEAEEEAGLFDPRRLAFIESIADLRPRMHRYCARMTGSALDGEDVMQETIFEAYLKLGSVRRLSSTRPLALQDRAQSLYRFPAPATGAARGRGGGRTPRVGLTRRRSRAERSTARSNDW